MLRPRRFLVLLFCATALATAVSLVRAQDPSPQQATEPTEFERDRTRGILAWKEAAWEPSPDELAGAIEHLERARADDPEQRDSTVEFLLGFCYLKNGRADLATPLLDRAYATAPDFIGFALIDGIALQVQRDAAGAVAKFRTFLERKAEFSGVEAIATEFEFLGHIHLGQALLDADQSTAGIHEFQIALELSERNRGSASPTCKMLLASAHMRAKEYGIAEALLREVVEKDPWSAVHAHHLGLLFADQQREEDARTWYLAAVERDPSYAPPYIKLAYLANTDRDFAAFRRYLEIYASLRHVGQPGHGDAQEDRDAAADVEAGLGIYWSSISGMRFDLGDEPGFREATLKAIEHYRRAVQIRPDCVRAMAELIQLLYAEPGEAAEEEREELSKRLELRKADEDAHHSARRSTFC